MKLYRIIIRTDALSTMEKLLEHENLLLRKIPLILMGGGGRSPPDHSAQSGGTIPPTKNCGGDVSPPSPPLVTPMLPTVFDLTVW